MKPAWRAHYAVDPDIHEDGYYYKCRFTKEISFPSGASFEGCQFDWLLKKVTVKNSYPSEFVKHFSREIKAQQTRQLERALFFRRESWFEMVAKSFEGERYGIDEAITVENPETRSVEFSFRRGSRYVRDIISDSATREELEACLSRLAERLEKLSFGG